MATDSSTLLDANADMPSYIEGTLAALAMLLHSEGVTADAPAAIARNERRDCCRVGVSGSDDGASAQMVLLHDNSNRKTAGTGLIIWYIIGISLSTAVSLSR